MRAIAHTLGELLRGAEPPLVLDEDGVAGAKLTSVVRSAFQPPLLGY